MKKIYFLALSIFASVSLMAAQMKVAAGPDLQAAVDSASSGNTIYDMLGRQIEGNINDLTAGMYIVVTENGTQTISINNKF